VTRMMLPHSDTFLSFTTTFARSGLAVVDSLTAMTGLLISKRPSFGQTKWRGHPQPLYMMKTVQCKPCFGANSLHTHWHQGTHGDSSRL
jgi:hypothetical protein